MDIVESYICSERMRWPRLFLNERIPYLCICWSLEKGDQCMCLHLSGVLSPQTFLLSVTTCSPCMTRAPSSGMLLTASSLWMTRCLSGFITAWGTVHRTGASGFLHVAWASVWPEALSHLAIVVCNFRICLVWEEYLPCWSDLMWIWSPLPHCLKCLYRIQAL